jgi:hypothetical protein
VFPKVGHIVFGKATPGKIEQVQYTQEAGAVDGGLLEDFLDIALKPSTINIMRIMALSLACAARSRSWTMSLKEARNHWVELSFNTVFPTFFRERGVLRWSESWRLVYPFSWSWGRNEPSYSELWKSGSQFES